MVTQRRGAVAADSVGALGRGVTRDAFGGAGADSAAGPAGMSTAGCQEAMDMMPFVPKVIDFHRSEVPRLRDSLRDKRRGPAEVDLPVWCLRWAHDSINGQMVFSTGRRQDRSVYELLHQLLSGETSPAEIIPLTVVLDGNRLFSISNRRLAALKMYQALRQNEVVRVPCLLYEACDVDIGAKYKDAMTTGPELGFGTKLLLRGQETQAWHMGMPLFRSTQEWCDGARGHPRQGCTPSSVPSAPPLGAPVAEAAPAPAVAAPEATSPIDLEMQRVLVDHLHAYPHLFRVSGSTIEVVDLQGGRGRAAGAGPTAGREDAAADGPSPAAGPRRADEAAGEATGTAFAETAAPPCAPPHPPPPPPHRHAAEAAAAQGAEDVPAAPAVPPPPPPPPAVPPQRSPSGPERGVACAPGGPPKAPPPLAGAPAAAQAVPPPPPKAAVPAGAQVGLAGLARGRPEQAAAAAPPAPGTAPGARAAPQRAPARSLPPARLRAASAPRSPRGGGAAAASPLAAGRTAPAGPSTSDLAVLRAAADAVAEQLARVRGRRQVASTLMMKVYDEVPLAKDIVKRFKLRGVCDNSGGRLYLDNTTIGSAAELVLVRDEPIRTASDQRLDAVARLSQEEQLLADEDGGRTSDSDASSRSEPSEDEGLEPWEQQEAADVDSAGPRCEYEEREDLEAALARQPHDPDTRSLTGMLVYGVYSCHHGFDFKHSRCRGEVLVERGPRAMRGCRVHIVGGHSRNRAFHFDRCWVRILRARVAPAGGAAGAAAPCWDAAAAERTVLHGRVVRAEEHGVTRPKLVVCVRSKVVRSRRWIGFRAIDSHVPTMAVPWDACAPLPDPSDLHVVELVDWRGSEQPRGRYVRRLNMQNRDSDPATVTALRLTCNLADGWGDAQDGAAEDRCFGDGPAGVPRCLSMPAISRTRKNLTADGVAVIAIGHPGWPVGMAFSAHEHPEPRLCVHVVDVNEYLDQPGLGALEELIRGRAAGLWLSDHAGRPASAALPLVPPEYEQAMSFREGEDQLAVTFTFPVDPQTRKTGLQSARHEESVVRCGHVLSPEVAAETLLHGKPDEVRRTLQAVLDYAKRVEAAAVEGSNPLFFEHLHPDLTAPPGSGGGAAAREDAERAPLLVGRLLAGCSYLVNRYAGKVLAQPGACAFLQPPGSDASESARPTAPMPVRVRGRPDPLYWAELERLVQRPGVHYCGKRRVLVRHVIEAVRHIMVKPQLTGRQQHCLQAAFLDRFLDACPASVYVLPESAWSSSSAGDGDAARSGQLFDTQKRLFHVDGPLCRYLDILGLRALKCRSGWRPEQPHMHLRHHELERVVARANGRQSQLRHATRIFRRVTLMRELAKTGWRVRDPVISRVGPNFFDVAVPAMVWSVVQLRVPVSALRSCSSVVSFSVEEQSLRMTCARVQEAGCSWHRRATWAIKGWDSSRLVSAVISRNFAQSVQNHAAPSAVVVSEIVFQGKTDTGYEDVVYPLGHRSAPEVFSCVPDLAQWHEMASEMGAYAQIWSKIRLCQIHAGAVENSTYTPCMPVQKLQWYDTQDTKKGVHRQCFQCLVGTQRHFYSEVDPCLQPEDLVILRCTTPRGDEAVFYGLVQEVKERQKAAPCSSPEEGTRTQGAPANGEEELRGLYCSVEVELSDSSVTAYKAQARRVTDTATDDCYRIQFVHVPLAEKKCLELLQGLARTTGATVEASPIRGFLTGARSPQEGRAQLEQRPLASVEQVSQALRGPFQVLQGTGLNERQLEGIKRALQSPVSMVQGPPGTGKTTFLVHLCAAIVNLEMDPTLESSWDQAKGRRERRGRQKEQQPGRILVCTPSNHAADEIVQRLAWGTDIPHRFITRVYGRAIERGHGSRYNNAGPTLSTHSDLRFDIQPGLEEHSLHFKTQHGDGVKPIGSQLPHDCYDAVAQRGYDTAYEAEETQVLLRSRIVVATCTSAVLHTALTKGKVGKMYRPVNFATVIVDEAAQASEPDVVLPSLLAEQRVVVIGDHKQLGPVVPERSLCKAYMCALETPFIERMLKGGGSRLPSNTFLNVQYRMHASIRRFPSRKFYDDKLQDETSTPALSPVRCIWPNEEERVVFVDCQTSHAFGYVVEDGRRTTMSPTLVEGNTSLKNEGEVQLVVEAFMRLIRQGRCNTSDIAIITPYRAQQMQIRDALAQVIGEDARSTAVGTVHALQGSERGYIILSFVRSTSEDLVASRGASSSASDTVVSEDVRSIAMRQICESNLGIVSNPKLLNVSLTRAKHGLVCIGNKEVLAGGSNDFFDLTEDLAKRGCVLSARDFWLLGSA